ncbi:AAA family ATPase [Pseudonocardia aurantiaca]|uniref:ParA family protein n=1 Tax=Pseudonocardia aurantiaca TaxID=75290 RepID=A0ABW4FQA8_9PSEU
MKVVAIINHKGGVGKTTLTANLGAGFAARGQKVLVIDLDAQASLTISFFTQSEWTADLLPSRTIKHWFDGIGTDDAMVSPAELVSSPPRVQDKLSRGTGRLDLIAAHRDLTDVETALAAELISDPHQFAALHGRLREALSHKDFAEYDTVLIDCAPNFGLIAKNAVAASDLLLIPTKPDYLSTNGIDSLGLKIRSFVEEYNEHSAVPVERPAAAVVFTMVQNQNGVPIEAQRSVISRIEAREVPTFATTIRDSKSVYGPAPEHGVPVILGGTGRAQTRELRDMVSELSGRLEGIAA